MPVVKWVSLSVTLEALGKIWNLLSHDILKWINFNQYNQKHF